MNAFPNSWLPAPAVFDVFVWRSFDAFLGKIVGTYAG